MNLPHYIYLASNEFQDYEFYSEGPKGRIRKIVLFTMIHEDPIIYNLAFGDADPIAGTVNDLVITDNKDTDIVLATVADTIHEFCDYYGNHYIYAEGSTPVRNRLYQIGMASLLDEISNDFEILGAIGSVWYKFRKNVNYDAFLVKRK